MATVRPITGITPRSVSTLEDTGLPLGFVLQPFAKFSSPSNKNSKNGTSRSKAENSNKSKPLSSSTSSSTTTLPTKACLVPKCTNCGSPFNPTCDIIRYEKVLCHFCGNTYSTNYETQSNINRHYRKEQTRRKYHDEYSLNVDEYSLPLFSVSTSSPSSQQDEINDIYSLPAKMCPPLLTILIDGTSSDPKYYSKISSSIHHLLHLNDEENKTTENNVESSTNFKGSRIGIFIMTKGGGLSVFDLKNPCGHLKHLWVHPPPLLRRKTQGTKSFHDDNESATIIPLSDVLDINEIYIPLDSDSSKSCIENVLRVLENSTILNQTCQRSSSSNSGMNYDGIGDDFGTSIGNTGEDNNYIGTYLGSTIQYILDFLDEVAYHPGMHQMTNDMMMVPRNNKNNDNSDRNDENDAVRKFLYAGGKIMCFLATSPHEIGLPSSFVPGGRIGTGGFGGSCAEIGKRFDERKDIDTPNLTNETFDQDEDDIEAGGKNNKIYAKDGTKSGRKSDDKYNLNNTPETAYLQVDEYYQDLGIQCAQFGLSIEVFGLVNETKKEIGDIYLGFPYLRLLSDRSGGNGPLILSILQDENDDNTNNIRNRIIDKNDIFLKEVLSRSTLTRPTAHAALFRIRLSPTLGINKDVYDELRKDDLSTKSNPKKTNNRLFEYFCTNGMFGSVSPTTDEELFLMGSCDTSTTTSMEVEITSRSGQVGNGYTHDEDGNEIKQCIQCTFSYTSVVKMNGKWCTVRRFRVSTQRLKVSTYTEEITSSLDSEALAVNRFHIFYAISLRYDFESVLHFATNWLLNVLHAYCLSEEVNQKIDRSKNHLLGEKEGKQTTSQSKLTKEQEQILLAQGHNKLQLVPLLTFCLIQCDALRTNERGGGADKSFNPSVDAKCAAAANMSSMPASVLSRCIKPRIEIWMSGAETSTETHDKVGMSFDDILFKVKDVEVKAGGEDETQRQEQPQRALLFIDSPQQTLLYDCNKLFELGDCNHIVNTRAEENFLEQVSSISMPKKLQNIVEEVGDEYRVSPPVVDSTIGVIAMTEGDFLMNMKEKVHRHFRDFLIEDSRLSNKNSFQEWLSLIAKELNSSRL